MEDNNDENNNNNNNNNNRRQYVEYWTRQEWRHIEAHADVDEHRAKEHDSRILPSTTVPNTNNEDDDQHHASASASYRYPTKGHVLYLQVGTKVRGPTCVFPNIQTGGELLSSVPKDDDDDDNDNDDDNDDDAYLVCVRSSFTTMGKSDHENETSGSGR
mmetsp:Transcript_24550/g.28423  ORF Transcript_24550/g.28423 Transcript_24550/m.28423 type:complete len:159 (+) Transcript_24550:255-731(+)